MEDVWSYTIFLLFLVDDLIFWVSISCSLRKIPEIDLFKVSSNGMFYHRKQTPFINTHNWHCSTYNLLKS